MSQKYALGIDLGTTHSALSEVALGEPEAQPVVLPIVQLGQGGTLEKKPLLPSFIYFAHAAEEDLSLPWDKKRRFTVGNLARERAAEVPGRVVSSAKSWLSHTGVDRRSQLLPLGAPDEIEKISPVEAAFRTLDHLAESWAQGHPGASLAEQEVVITVPASFDAAARDLTVEAAYAAGIEDLTLLEEPQAALYAWIQQQGSAFNQQLKVGDVVLVVDVGGGTTDFSAISVEEVAGALELRRVAVGDHILLGGDNMDWALAQSVSQKLAAEGKELDPWQLQGLMHACRSAKETLLGVNAPPQVSVTLPSRGSGLFAGLVRSELLREEVTAQIVDGFFPRVSWDAQPTVRARMGLSQLGLPYAQDAAITKHLAAFLRRQASALKGESGAASPAEAPQINTKEPLGVAPQNNASQPFLCPTAVLFNGGVFKSPVLQARLLETLNSWLTQLGKPVARVLEGADLDLAVARGAAFYALVKHGRGLRIRGGTAQAYYVGMESPMPAVPGMEPPVTLVCAAPFGIEEGAAPEVLKQKLAVVVGEPVTFRFFGSSVRRGDQLGTELTRWSAQEILELSPIEITFPSLGRAPGTLVPVSMTASVTAVGTLLLEAVPLEPLNSDERFKIELSVRQHATSR